MWDAFIFCRDIILLHILYGDFLWVKTLIPSYCLYLCELSFSEIIETNLVQMAFWDFLAVFLWLISNVYISAFQISLTYSFFIPLSDISSQCRDLFQRKVLMHQFWEFIVQSTTHSLCLTAGSLYSPSIGLGKIIYTFKCSVSLAHWTFPVSTYWYFGYLNLRSVRPSSISFCFFLHRCQ